LSNAKRERKRGEEAPPDDEDNDTDRHACPRNPWNQYVTGLHPTID